MGPAVRFSVICRPSSVLRRPSFVLRPKENRALAGPVQFVDVGASTIHLPEGNICRHCEAPIWEDEATACRAARGQYASRGAGTQRRG